MARTNVELYEALKQTVGSDAARMIAEVVPPAADLATKADLTGEVGSLRSEMSERFADVRTEFAEVRTEIAALRGEMHAETTRNIKWMLGFFIPVWAGTWATVVAVVVKL